jgi:hypothetical protein
MHIVKWQGKEVWGFIGEKIIVWAEREGDCTGYYACESLG